MDNLLTIEETAARMGMSVRYVRRLVSERWIAFVKMGRSVRLDPADVSAFIKTGRVEPMTAANLWSRARRVA